MKWRGLVRVATSEPTIIISKSKKTSQLDHLVRHLPLFDNTYPGLIHMQLPLANDMPQEMYLMLSELTLLVRDVQLIFSYDLENLSQVIHMLFQGVTMDDMCW